jgi:hypothetical protein
MGERLATTRVLASDVGDNVIISCKRLLVLNLVILEKMKIDIILAVTVIKRSITVHYITLLS